MSENSAIQWTTHTWNPWHGCHKISPGCKNCYMFADKARYGQNPDVVVRSKTTFNAPLKWKDPAFVFTCSWSDWFIQEADEWRHDARDIILATPHLTYQLLTKRPERAHRWIPARPDPNVWLGVSVEDRKYGLPRIDVLREIPAKLRFLPIEPLLENIGELDLRGIGWVIIGGESGHGARPLNLAWVRGILRQCRAIGVPVFVKQLGARAFDDGHVRIHMGDHKGGRMEEWPEDLRVREMPKTT